MDDFIKAGCFLVGGVLMIWYYHYLCDEGRLQRKWREEWMLFEQRLSKFGMNEEWENNIRRGIKTRSQLRRKSREMQKTIDKYKL